MGSDTESTTGADKPSLPKLLASLALGARAVNALPIARENENNDDDDYADDNEDLDDEFAFRMSLPEFASLNNEAQQSLSSLLCQALECAPSSDNHDDKTTNDNDELYEIDDPELWERCADACDALYDRVTAYISQEQRNQGGETDEASLALSAISNVAQRARTNASGSYGRMIQGLADMERPQNVYQGFVTQPPQNSRMEPFVPVIVYDGNKQAKLDGGEFTKEGHGLDTRFDNGGGGENEGEKKRDVTRRKYSPDMMAPSYHYEHPYREEIETLEYRPWQLDVSDVESKDAKQIAQCNKTDDGVWIGNEEDLAKLVSRINDGQENGEIQEIALDLEAHSHRTFAGFLCLIQLSIRRPKSPPSSDNKQSTPPDISTGYDFLIDALSLRHVISAHLGPILANPNILKIMHGADSDIPWLQRDFGCYIVNLFDTGRASRALKFASAGLAYLLRKYAGVEADKAHQLSDWRRRPLPEDMRSYAVSDTRYLLDIYDQLRLELEGNSLKDVSIMSVLDRSKQVCLIRYDKEPFRPSGYLTIMDGKNSRRRNANKNSRVTSELSSLQEAVLKALFDWRDKTARQEDESAHYVCSNAALLRIASNRPVTVAALQRLVNPLPPLVMRRSQEILDAIKVSTGSAAVEKSKGTVDSGDKKVNPVKLTVPPPSASRNREMLSPILGSEALYQQAGWMTPTFSAGNGSSGASESEADEGIQQFLDVNVANKGYSATHHTSHGIEMSPPSLENDSDAIEDDAEAKRSSRGASTDGLGTTQAALGNNSGGSIEEDVRVAQRSANLIQKEMIKLTDSGKPGKFGNGFSLIDLIRPMPMSEDVDFDKEQDTNGNSAGGDTSADKDDTPGAAPEEDEMAIPKSMREIYKLSNANRRRTGKEKVIPKPLQFPDENNKEIEKFKEDDIQGAEAIIASRGGPGGYFGSSPSKRQRTAPGKEGDIKLMTKMGWVKDKKDAESLAVVPADQQAAEKDRHNNHGPQYKKSSGKGGSADYYSSMGAGMGAFDPNAAASKNPFFAGAATGAAAMLHGESKGKSQKRNKKR
eukprot:CAMPEP_0172322716 /NCGR_PEP_ID=MMETSP1058-20130122/46705_1 /TAXON_ID=83371 /ORGANISM="Detonula confervacea, Strain CCMP 353" /LENGTH=1045 /DNA_ID=CAMNT_0013038533 /DNA_START=70 /DNA_END=3207 /DNA_ORIENTATION=+